MSDSPQRLTLQHRIWKRMLDGRGLYPQDVQDTINRLLSPNLTFSPPVVLDLGSGSGVWSVNSFPISTALQTTWRTDCLRNSCAFYIYRAVEMAATYPHAKVVGLDLAEPKLQCVHVLVNDQWRASKCCESYSIAPLHSIQLKEEYVPSKLQVSSDSAISLCC